MYFLLKKHKSLDFSFSSFKPTDRNLVPSVSVYEGKSNAKLHRLIDDTYVIQVGSEIYPLKSLNMKDFIIVDNNLQKISEVKEKFFIAKPKKEQSE